MVEGVSSDIISHISTNIIRQPLIAYTRDVASLSTVFGYAPTPLSKT